MKYNTHPLPHTHARQAGPSFQIYVLQFFWRGGYNLITSYRNSLTSETTNRTPLSQTGWQTYRLSHDYVGAKAIVQQISLFALHKENLG